MKNKKIEKRDYKKKLKYVSGKTCKERNQLDRSVPVVCEQVEEHVNERNVESHQQQQALVVVDPVLKRVSISMMQQDTMGEK